MSTLAVNSKASIHVPSRNLLASHPFIAFFVLAFGGTWLLFAPIVLGQEGLGLLPYRVPLWLYVTLFLAGTFLGPTLAAFVVTAALDGKEGVRHFVRRYGQWRVGLQWYLAFLLGFPAIYLIPASFWMGIEPYQALVQQWGTWFTIFLPGVLVFPAIINWGEEAGWRGFAQTRMQAQYGALRTALLVGFLHSIWHLPVFLLVEGPVALGPFELRAFLVNTFMILALTMVWTWIFNGAKQSILIASLTHATFNATQNWLTMVLPHQPDQVGSAVMTIILVSSVLLIILTKGQLGYTVEQSPQKDYAA